MVISISKVEANWQKPFPDCGMGRDTGGLVKYLAVPV